MTSKPGAGTDAVEPPGDDLVRDTCRLIVLTFIHNVEVIAKSQKPETLLKMIQSCKELKPVDRSNRELWQLIQKVRNEVLGGRPNAAPLVDKQQRQEKP